MPARLRPASFPSRSLRGRDLGLSLPQKALGRRGQGRSVFEVGPSWNECGNGVRRKKLQVRALLIFHNSFHEQLPAGNCRGVCAGRVSRTLKEALM